MKRIKPRGLQPKKEKRTVTCWICDGEGKWDGENCYRCDGKGTHLDNVRLFPCIGGPFDGGHISSEDAEAFGYNAYNSAVWRGNVEDRPSSRILVHKNLLGLGEKGNEEKVITAWQ